MLSYLALALLSPSAAWYVDERCVAVADLVYSAQLVEAEHRIAEMSASDDPDTKACGLWVRTMMKEMAMALLDDQEPLWDEMGKDLNELEQFGRDHQAEMRFKDLILEADFRRVRVFAAQGNRTSAILAARRAGDMLALRRSVKQASPSYYYAEAVTNLAVTHADWHIRLVMNLVGLHGDGNRGKQAMKILLSKPSVYRSEAMVVARSFSLRVPGLFEDPVVYSAALHAKHPANPQLTFDYAVDLAGIGRCAEALPALGAMETSQASFSKNILAKFARARSACGR